MSKNLNSITPGFRDYSLNQNIGKYSQITQSFIYPIGNFIDIYGNVEIKKESLTPNGLLDYVNNSNLYKRKGEFEEDINNNYISIRDLSSSQINYDSSILPQYNYDNVYHDVDKKDYISLGINSVIGYVLGDNIGLNSINNGIDIVSSSLETSTSLLGRLSEYALGNESKLGEIGLINLGTSMANTVLQKTRINENTEKFLEKAVDFYDSIDTLEFDKMGASKLPSKLIKYSNNMLPIYFYTDVKKSNTNNLSWLNENSMMVSENNDKENISFPKQSLLYKTNKLFQSGRIQTLIDKISSEKINGDSSVSSNNPVTKSRNLKTKDNNGYCRNWTSYNQYNKISSLVRPFDEENTEKLNNNLNRVRPNSDSTSSLSKYGVLQDNGFVKISPYKDDNFNKNEIKKYMFSIENLAWKDSIDSLIENTSQEGPNGGRIMWFPPYDINFNETTSVNWNSDTFIGRGEPVYTYTNTERNGTLSFKIIVDHPSIINYYKQSNQDVTEEDYLRLFAGSDVLELKDETKEEEEQKIKSNSLIASIPRTVKFKVFFPNNYSGIKDGYENAIKYLYQGYACEINPSTPRGYEMETGEWMGLTPSNMDVGCYLIEEAGGVDNAYYYRADTYQNITQEQKKDTYSYGLNSSKSDSSDPNVYSFKEVYEFINNPYLSQNEEQEKINSRYEYINKYLSLNDSIVEKDIAKLNDDIAVYMGWSTTADTTNLYNMSLSLYETLNSEFITSKQYYENLNPNGWSLNIQANNINSDNFQSGYNYDKYFYDLKYKLEGYEMALNDLNDAILNYINISKSHYILETATLNDVDDAYDNYISYLSNLELKKQELIDVNTKFKNQISTTKSYNDFYQTLLDASSITIVGSASKQGKESQNTVLADNRINLIKNWLTKYNPNTNYTISNAYSESEILPDKNTNSKAAKLERFSYVVITTKPESLNIEGIANEIGYTTKINKENSASESLITSKRKKQPFYNYYDKNGFNLKNDESNFFEKISKNKEQEFIFNKLTEKIKYFSPAFHSTTPEGFNSRLTFLHQCTRQGPTLNSTNLSNGKRTVNNMAFGRPPICILRIGDFYNTKVVFDSLNIDFDPLVWDLNQEGIGVQPMIANVTMNFKFIGGSDLTGPIARLQNAITFNFFANTGVYDDRNDRITNHEYNTDTKKYENKYDALYNPGVYDNGISTIVDNS